MEQEMTKKNTIQGELERIFEVLRFIEQKIGIETLPEEALMTSNKLVALSDDIYYIANKLENINTELDIIGK